jgi:hypothetical protein
VILSLHIKTVPWFRQLVAGFSLRRPEFASRSVYVGFVVGKWYCERFFKVLQFWLSILIYHMGMNIGPIGDHSSETHHIDMKMNMSAYLFILQYCNLYVSGPI